MENKKKYLLGLFLILFIFNNIVITSTLLLLKISITKINLALAIIITIIIYIKVMTKEKYEKQDKIKNIIIFTLIIVTSIAISGQIYDTTYDSNTYHKTSIGELKEGWNPIYETIEEHNKSKKNETKLTNTYEIWNNHYAKSYDYYAANIYTVTGNIETGKSIYPITIIATFLICFTYLNIKYQKKISAVLSLLISLNPITLCQLGTFYNDGLLGNYLILMIITLTVLLTQEEKINKKYNYALYFITLVILINIKFTGLAYAGIYSMLYYTYILLNKKQRKEHIKAITTIGITSLIVGIMVVGLSTYPKNLKNNSHPFYPIYGENSIDIMEGNTPNEIKNKNRFERFLIANFSETHNSMELDYKYKIKIPFTFKIEELKYYIGPDVRIGGFGVLFSGILIISILIILKEIKKQKQKTTIYLMPIIGTIILITILKDAWWARYIPQLYIIPIIALILNKNKEETKKQKITNIALIVLLTINTILIAGPATLNIILEKQKVEESFKELKIEKDTKIIIKTEEFTGAVYNIKDKYKNIQNVKELEEENYTKYELMGTRISLPCYIKKETN
ncbi:MAG: hypothetical protein HFE04_03035 [Bacilli bacterium]|nr:hypothetical protein [Bacilli bacterium]